MQPRNVLHSVGVVNWRRLLPGLIMQALPILCLGALLQTARWNGFYFMVVLPLFAGGLFSLWSASIAGWMGWRNRYVAGGVGFISGVLAYLAQFYVLLVHAGGLPVAWRLDLVPEVIKVQVAHMVIEGEGIDEKRNLTFVIFEALIVGSAFAVMHVDAARKNYCPVCRTRLKSKSSSLLPPNFTAALCIGLEEGSLHELPADDSGGEIEGDAWSNVDILYCFHGSMLAEPKFYLTLVETQFVEGQRFDAVLLDKVEITADEMIAIAEKCPRLAISSDKRPKLFAPEADSTPDAEAKAEV